MDFYLYFSSPFIDPDEISHRALISHDYVTHVLNFFCGLFLDAVSVARLYKVEW
jgi:hypothetical protein